MQWTDLTTIVSKAFSVSHLPAATVSFLSGPAEFHRSLVELIKGAKEKICLSSLYFGNGRLEQGILEGCLLPALAGKPALRATLISDFNRGCRSESKEPSFEPAGLSSKNLSFSPQRRPSSGWRWLGKLRELLGVYHIKFYSSEDCVILTGANFATHYLTSRHDRYLKVQSAPSFAGHVAQISTGTAPNGTAFMVGGKHETLIVPLIQDFPGGVCQEEQFLLALLRAENDLRAVKLVSGYLNPTDSLLDALRCSGAQITLVGASGESNAMFGSHGLLRFAPTLYRTAALRAKELVGEGCESWDYCRPGTSFHGKGMWFRGDDFSATLIGSSSLGCRSWRRDREMGFLVATKAPGLMHEIENDFDRIFDSCTLLSGSAKSSHLFFFKLLKSFL